MKTDKFKSAFRAVESAIGEERRAFPDWAELDNKAKAALTRATRAADWQRYVTKESGKLEADIAHAIEAGSLPIEAYSQLATLRLAKAEAPGHVERIESEFEPLAAELQRIAKAHNIALQ